MAKKILDLGSSTVTEDEAVETVDLFVLDDKTYTIPKEVSAGITLKYMEKQAEEGPDAAVYYMFVELLGKDAFNALKNHPRLKKSDLDQIMSVVEKHALSDESGK